MQRCNEFKVVPLLASTTFRGFPGGTVVKNPPANTGDTRDIRLIPGSGRSLGAGNELMDRDSRGASQVAQW